MELNIKNYQLCTQCVMDTSDPEISFNETGECNHCTGFFETSQALSYNGATSDAKFKELINTIKLSGKGKSYDCLLGISGGIDSAYVAHILKENGVRVLLLHMDNGWNSEKAIHNIHSIANRTGFNYESYILNWQEFRDLQLAFLKASVIEAETPTDVAIAGALHEVAAKYKIKYIVSGINIATEGILPKMWHYDPKDKKFQNAVHQKFGKLKLRKFPTFPYWKEIYCKVFKGMRMVYILNLLPFSKKAALEFLEQNYDYKKYEGKHHESKFTAFIQSYFLPVKFNLDYRRATLSTQICAGEISREEALEELKTPPFNYKVIETDTKYVCKKLEISSAEFKEILNAPVKTYRDFPNNEKRLKYLYDIYKKYFSNYKI